MSAWKFWRPSQPTADQTTTADAVMFEDDGNVVEAVGEASYQEEISAITGSRTWEDVRCEVVAALVPEPSNRYDANAVCVNIDGQRVGYLSRGDAIDYQVVVQALAAQGKVAACKALICGRAPERATTPNMGVFLCLPTPQDCLASLG